MPIHPELTTLAYVTTPDRSRVLLVHRVARESDTSTGPRPDGTYDDGRRS